MSLDRIRIVGGWPLGIAVEVRWIGMAHGPWTTFYVETIGL